MAASRSALKNISAVLPSDRISFAKIHEPLEVPNSLDLQINSHSWPIGNEAWQADVGKRPTTGRTDVNTRSGSEEISPEISPTEDFNKTMSLSFRDHRFEEPEHSIKKCKNRDATYAALLFVTAEFVSNEADEIKSQTVSIGDFPLVTDKGILIANGTERVVISQLVRLPGVHFEIILDRESDKDIYSRKAIPSRDAWLESEIDKRDMVSVCLDHKRKQNVTALLEALGQSEDRTLEEFGGFESIHMTLERDAVNTQDEALLDIYRKLRPGEPPAHDAVQVLLENYYFNPERCNLARVGRYRINKRLGFDLSFDSQVLTTGDIVTAVRHVVVLHEHKEELNGLPIETDDINHFDNR